MAAPVRQKSPAIDEESATETDHIEDVHLHGKKKKKKIEFLLLLIALLTSFELIYLFIFF